jgi:hypothetical protein
MSPPPPAAPSPTLAPSRGVMRAIFGTPKKARTPPKPQAPPPRLENNLARHLRSDGTLARASISFKDIAHKCDTRLFETTYPLVGQRVEEPRLSRNSTGVSVTRAVGELVLQIFRLPALPGISPDSLPQSLDDCQNGLRYIVWHKTTHFEGNLTQNGGDCSVSPTATFALA